MSLFDISLGCFLVMGPSLCAQSTSAIADTNFTLHASSDLVVLNVAAHDARGVNIRGLRLQDFQVYEDGRPQTIKQFADEDRPVTIGILVDASGSMRSKQAEVVMAALSFVHASNPQDEVFVINFNDSVSMGLPPTLPFSNEPNELRKALLGRKPEGKTALYDALILASDHLAKGKFENKALLLISDGGDNNSTHRFSDAMNSIAKSGAVVYSIGIFDPDEPEHNLSVLRRLSKMSGGETFTPQQLSEIRPLCLRIAADIRASYTLAYTPPEPDQHAAFRKLKVIAAAPDGPKLTVRTRTSYILPDR